MLKYNISKSTLYSLIKIKILDKKTHKANIYEDLFWINKEEIDKISHFIDPLNPINFIEDRINAKIRHRFFIKKISNKDFYYKYF